MEPTTELYFESHITIEPLSDAKQGDIMPIVNTYEFRIADLIMRNGRPHMENMFVSARSEDYKDICTRTKHVVNALQCKGIKVLRYKVENTLLDSRKHDIWKCL